MTSIGGLFLLLTGGMFLVLFRVPYTEIGSRYYRLITLICLVGWTVVLATMQPEAPPHWFQFGGILSLLALGGLHVVSLSLHRPRLRRGIYWTGVLVLIGLFLSLGFWPPGGFSQSYYSSPLTLFLQFTLTAAILGSILDAMICGHWYLVNRGLTLRPIRSISRTLDVAIILKILVLSLIVIELYLNVPDRFNRVVLGTAYLFWVRFVSSLPFGLILNWMSGKALDVGNTQASTGILYAAVVFVVLGEFFGYFLTLYTGVAL